MTASAAPNPSTSLAAQSSRAAGPAPWVARTLLRTVAVAYTLALSWLVLAPDPWIVFGGVSRQAEQVVDSTLADWLQHASAYALCGGLLWFAFPRWRIPIAMLGLAHGGLSEVVQGFVPQRTYDWRDLVANLVGFAAACCVSAFWLRTRRPGASLPAAPAASEPRAAATSFGASETSSLARYAPRRVHLLVAALLATGLALYGSLVPLDYRPLPLEEAIARFRALPYLNLGIQSRADFVANILLFIPLGFLWLGTLAVDRRPLALKIFLAMGVLSVGTLAGAGIEFVQLWFPTRTASLNDCYAQIGGNLLGVCLWLWLGQPLVEWGRGFFARSRPSSRLDFILQAYLIGLAIYSVLPLDLTIALSSLLSKWRDGRVVLVPLSDAQPTFGYAYQSLMDGLTFLPVGLLAARLLFRFHAPRAIADGHGKAFAIPRVVVLSGLAGGLFSLAIEAAQLFVFSRFTSTTDILWGTLGSTLGGLVAAFVLRPQADRQSPPLAAAAHGTAAHGTADHSTADHSTADHSTADHSTADHSTADHVHAAGVVADGHAEDCLMADRGTHEPRRWKSSLGWMAAGLVYAAILVVLFCFPFEFLRDKAELRDRYEGLFSRVPFEVLYRGSEFNAITQVLRKSLLFGLLGTLAVLATRRLPGPPVFRQVVLMGLLLASAALGLGIELLQVALPPHVADLTDAALYMLGAIAGAVIGSAVLGTRHDGATTRSAPG